MEVTGELIKWADTEARYALVKLSEEDSAEKILAEMAESFNCAGCDCGFCPCAGAKEYNGHCCFRIRARRLR